MKKSKITTQQFIELKRKHFEEEFGLYGHMMNGGLIKKVQSFLSSTIKDYARIKRKEIEWLRQYISGDITENVDEKTGYNRALDDVNEILK